ncbi:MAG: hypothetical protein HYR89_07265, partial [Actinobacteria bacterium]|nr:hypothetical protein [Actinomycetota bacterium]
MDSVRHGGSDVDGGRAPETPEAVNSRQNAGMVAKLVLALVERRAGEAGVQAVLKRAGETRSAEELSLDGTWSSYEQGKALFEAAASILGDAHIGRDIGEGVLEERLAMDMAAVLRSFGSPARIMEQIGVIGSKYSTTFNLIPEEVGEQDAVITARSTPGFPPYRLWCDFTVGLLSQVPVIFGYGPANIVEETCETEGDDCCRFQVSWSLESPAMPEPERRIIYLEQQLRALHARFEAMQRTTTDLISAEDLVTLSERILDRAGSVVRGQQFLLTVRPMPGAAAVVYHSGLDDERSAAIARDRVAGHSEGISGSQLVVEVASSRRSYGHLVAIQPFGTHFLDQERIALSEYASL